MSVTSDGSPIIPRTRGREECGASGVAHRRPWPATPATSASAGGSPRHKPKLGLTVNLTPILKRLAEGHSRRVLHVPTRPGGMIVSRKGRVFRVDTGGVICSVTAARGGFWQPGAGNGSGSPEDVRSANGQAGPRPS